MKRIVLVLFSITLCACGTQKTLTNSKEKTVENIESSTAQKDSTNTEINVVTRDSSAVSVSVENLEAVNNDTEDETIIVTSEYDTTLPKDPETGKHPLKKEVTESRRKIDKTKSTRETNILSNKEDKQISEAMVEIVETSTKIEDVTLESNIEIEVESEKKKGLSGWLILLCFIGGIVLIFGLIWTIKKLFNNRLKLF